VLDLDGEGLRPDPVVGEAPAGRDLELPAVAGAANELAVTAVGVVEAGQRRPRHRPEAQRPGPVRAAVVQREELAADVEDADRETTDLLHDALARDKRLDPAHFEPPAHAATRAARPYSSRAFSEK